MSDHASSTFIADEIDQNFNRSLKGQKLWSLANSGSTILIVVFSATAAVLTQIKGTYFILDNNSFATGLSLAVTIISTIQTKLGFERKWAANRMTRSALQQLKIDEETGVDPADLAKTLKVILAKHDEAITGTSSSG